MIRSIIERTGVKIDVEDDGRVNVASADEASAQKAIGIIQELTATPELNKTYMGKVQRITDFGAFVEIMPGLDGLLHVSEIAHYRVKDVRDELKEGRTGDGQGDQHRPLGQDSAQPQGAADAGRRPEDAPLDAPGRQPNAPVGTSQSSGPASSAAECGVAEPEPN